MALEVVSAGPTTVLTLVTSVAQAFSPNVGEPAVYRVSCVDNIHIHVSKAGTAATTANSLIVTGGAPIYVRINPGETMSVIDPGAGASCYITRQFEF